MASTRYTYAWVGDSAIVYQRQPDWRPGDLMLRRVNPASGHFVGEPTVLLANLPEVRTISVDNATGTLMWVTRVITDELHFMSLPESPRSRLLTRSLNAFLGNPKFSPDGQRVVYTRQDALGSNAYMMDLQDGAEIAVSSDTVAATTVFWPSAQQVLRSGADGTLISFDLATGRARRYVTPPGEAVIGVAANSWMLSRERAAALIQRDSLLNNPRTIPDPPGLGQLDDGAVSPDGNLVLQLGTAQDRRSAFAVYNTTTQAWSAITLLDTITRRATNIATDGSVYFTRFNGRTEIWRTRVGGVLTLYATLPVQCYEGSVTVSDDGTRVVCNVTTSLPDVWMMELPKRRR